MLSLSGENTVEARWLYKDKANLVGCIETRVLKTLCKTLEVLARLLLCAAFENNCSEQDYGLQVRPASGRLDELSLFSEDQRKKSSICK